jgi:ATP-dependent DNA helicase RecQ
MLVSYFGEKNSENCEVCDICLKRKRSAINEKQLSDIEKNIFTVLSGSSHTITEVVGKMPFYKENDVLTILRCLIEEGLVQSEGEIVKLA